MYALREPEVIDAFPKEISPQLELKPSLLQGTIGLREIFRILNRRKQIIIASIIVTAMLTAIITYQLTPLYRADTLLMVDARQTQVLDVKSVVSGLPQEAAALRSEVEIIKSRSMASRVIDRLKLDRAEDFASDNSRSVLSSLGSSILALLPEAVLDVLPGKLGEKPVELSPDEIAARHRASVINTVRRNLSVENEGQTFTIQISYAHPDPVRAAQIADTYADEYLVDQLQAKFDATKKANDWLSQRLADLKEEVQAAERAAQTFREQAGLIETKGSTVAGQQVLEINSQLVLARTERAQAEARLRNASELRGNPDALNAVADVLASPLIQRLREKESEVRRREAELSERYGDRHPSLINVRAEYKDLQQKIREEVNKIIQALQNQVNIARAKERTLANALNDVERQSGVAMRQEVQLRELEREAEASRALYENFLGRFKQTTEQQGLAQPDARIIATAQVPLYPAFPKKTLFLAGGLVLGAIIGLTIAFLLEFLFRGFYDRDMVEQMTGYAAIGLIPGLPGARVRPEDYVLEKPTSAYAEALRTLRTALHFSNVDSPPKVVMVTSALPREGKTTLCASLGRLVAASGHKVLLIDADLRRPGLTSVFGDKGQGDVSDIASDDPDLGRMIQHDEKSGADYIVAREGTPNPQDLLGSMKMARFIKQMGQKYDLVIIDTPPVMAVSDCAPISRLADAVLFAVRWGETPRELTVAGLKQLASYGCKIAGVALTRVDLKKYSYYGQDYHYSKEYYAS